MNTKKTNRITIGFLAVIISLSAFFRIYKLDTIPASLNWDEVAAGYNAFTIANWGRDEWGNLFPLVFTSFKDDKHPVHIYFTAISVKLLGLNDFSARLPAALFGVLSVAALFWLAKILFKNDLTALLAALFLAVSPYNIHFSRGLWETNFALFFFVFGLLMFYRGINKDLDVKKKAKIYALSVLGFGLSFLSYHSSKVIIPPIALLLLLLYFRELKRDIKYLIPAAVIASLFLIVVIFNPRILGFARAQQTQIQESDIKKTVMFQQTNNITLGTAETVFNHYIAHYSTEYLFTKGDQSPRNSERVFGEFYPLDAPFLLIGLLALLLLKSRVTLIILAWILLAPIPSSLANGQPAATRALFMMGSFQLIAALGASSLVKIIPTKILKSALLVIILLVLGYFFKNYLDYYYNVYPKKDVVDWQYGMKQSVEFVKEHNGYGPIFVTDVRSQPYIFFLYYLKVPLPEFLKTVKYNYFPETEKFNTVESFDRFYFGGWNRADSPLNPGTLYIVSPSEYGGLRNRDNFDVKKKVTFPDGGDAFFLVSYP